jgi:hypothetical protein
LNVGAERDGVIALGDRVEELVQADGPSRRVAGGEVLPLEHPRHREVRRLTDDLLEGQRPEPLRIEPHLGSSHVQDFPQLRLVRLGIVPDLVPRERPARLGAARRVADHPGEVADDDDDLVAQLLEVAQLLQHHGVAEVQVGRRRVEPELDLQRDAGLE